VVDESLGVGRFTCEASFVEGEDELPPAPRSSAEATLSLLQDGRTEKTYRLRKDVISIGRLPESDVRISDPGASRQHARILRREEGFVLVDLGSTNGTLVNGELAHERRLEDGDRITIGNAELEFRSG
jgi:pSer/pThr/pTyr-binding forkhead associated (FHA) protein